jgi:hypothetical protein
MALEALMSYIKKTISPKSWDDIGGEGTIQFYGLGCGLVVNQTQAVQEQIIDLLQGLRKMNTQVELRCKLVEVDKEGKIQQKSLPSVMLMDEQQAAVQWKTDADFTKGGETTNATLQMSAKAQGYGAVIVNVAYEKASGLKQGCECDRNLGQVIFSTTERVETTRRVIPGQSFSIPTGPHGALILGTQWIEVTVCNVEAECASQPRVPHYSSLRK